MLPSRLLKTQVTDLEWMLLSANNSCLNLLGPNRMSISDCLLLNLFLLRKCHRVANRTEINSCCTGPNLLMLGRVNMSLLATCLIPTSEYICVGDESVQVHWLTIPSETERNWDLDLAEDVKGEVEKKYGQVRRIKVDKMSAVSESLYGDGKRLTCVDQGDVYIEFETIKYADTAVKGLNGRFFGGRQLRASYITEALFKAHL